MTGQGKMGLVEINSPSMLHGMGVCTNAAFLFILEHAYKWK